MVRNFNRPRLKSSKYISSLVDINCENFNCWLNFPFILAVFYSEMYQLYLIHIFFASKCDIWWVDRPIPRYAKSIVLSMQIKITMWRIAVLLKFWLHLKINNVWLQSEGIFFYMVRLNNNRIQIIFYFWDVLCFQRYLRLRVNKTLNFSLHYQIQVYAGSLVWKG